MASNASLIVTPFMFRAVTSSPVGNRRSIFLTGGSVRCFLSASLSSMVLGDVLTFLRAVPSSTSYPSQMGECFVSRAAARANGSLPVERLGFLGDLQLFPFGLCAKKSAPVLPTSRVLLSMSSTQRLGCLIKCVRHIKHAGWLTQVRDVEHPCHAGARPPMLLFLFRWRGSRDLLRWRAARGGHGFGDGGHVDRFQGRI